MTVGALRRLPAPGWGVALALLLTTAGYAPALRGVFVFDDGKVVVQNSRIKSFEAFFSAPDLLQPRSRAITDLTFAFNYAASRLEPTGYHLVNLAIHSGASPCSS
jgi:protein O-mannosyl-transferase